MSNEDFMSLMDPTHYVGRLILMHLFFLDFNMSMKVIQSGLKDPARLATMRIENWVARKDMTKRWLGQLHDGLPKHYKPYGRWLIDLIRGS